MQKNTNTKYVDYLKEDTPIPGQLWVCISFLSPEGIKNCTVRGLKVRGVYGTKQEAEKRAEELNKIDPDFHVFVGETGKWLPWDPEPDNVQDNVYQEKELNDLMKAYKENRDKAKTMQQERKEDLIRKAAVEEQSKTNNTNTNNKSHDPNKARDRLRKKLEDRQQGAKVEEVEDIEEVPAKVLTDKEKELRKLEEQVKAQDNFVKEELTSVHETQKQIADKEQTVNTINDKLAKIQELYGKLNQKK